MTAVAASDFECDLRHLVAQTTEVMACYDSSGQCVAISSALRERLQRLAEAIGQTDLGSAVQPPQPSELGTYGQQVVDVVKTVLQTGQAERRVHTLLADTLLPDTLLPDTLLPDMPTTDMPTVGKQTGAQHYETTYTPLKDKQGRLYQILSIGRAMSPVRLQSATLNNLPAGVEMPGLETASLSDLSTARTKARRCDRVQAIAHQIVNPESSA